MFDCVATCIGHHVYPHIPTFPGQEEFQGKIIHSHSLKKAQGFDDMRVVVIGVGNSGMDAAVELSSVAKQVRYSKISVHIIETIPRNLHEILYSSLLNQIKFFFYFSINVLHI